MVQVSTKKTEDFGAVRIMRQVRRAGRAENPISPDPDEVAHIPGVYRSKNVRSITRTITVG